jgi:diguanylate cyclase (GGDEF)-like protein
MSLYENLTTLKSNFQVSANAFQISADALDLITKYILSDDKTTLESKIAMENELDNLNSKNLGDVLIFGDINNFKSLNESIGHDGGDEAIKEIGERINKLVVKKLSARAFRQSGDEFVILLKPENLQNFIELAKSHFAEIRFKYLDKPVKIAISFGYAKSEESLEMREQLKRADKACRPAKIKGDGECEEWNKNLENNYYSDNRATCQNCNTIIKVQFNNSLPAKIQICPVCLHSFTDKNKRK